MRTYSALLTLIGALAVACVSTSPEAQDAPAGPTDRANPVKPRYVDCEAVELGMPCTPEPNLPSRPASAPQVRNGTYLGRRIARTMSYHGADWLVRPEREAEEDTDQLLEALALKPGSVACDFGAGNGYHSLRLARTVGSEGRVIASDLQPEMLTLLQARAEQAEIDNIDTVQATDTDPRLGEGACDLILLVDVYHELSNPAAVLARLRSALKPEGRLALVEFRAGDPKVPIKPLHTMTQAQMKKELTANRFELIDAYDDLPWQHLMFFGARRQ